MSKTKLSRSEVKEVNLFSIFVFAMQKLDKLRSRRSFIFFAILNSTVD